MNSLTLIRAEEVSKKYVKSLRRSMVYGMADISRDLLGLSTRSEKLRPGEFWSLDNVSFALRRGECLGLIGPNGAGKSSLLKLLNGLMIPDRGRILTRGRVGALIEVGAGFHPQLTGRENIYVNASILGMKKVEVNRRIDSIIAFSELGDHIDSPVKFYSSGMYVRLGFAVVAHLNPDVLLIDEVLAVGDAGFRSKCYNALDESLSRSAAVFVSHNMEAVSRICTRVMVLDKGRVLYDGDPVQATTRYSQLFSQGKEQLSKDPGYECLGVEMQSSRNVGYGDSLAFRVRLKTPRRHENVLFLVTLTTASGEIAAEFRNDNVGLRLDLEAGISAIQVRLDDVKLLPRRYDVTFLVIDRPADHLFWLRNMESVTITGNHTGVRPYQISGHVEVSLSAKNKKRTVASASRNSE